jgi:hypothetical protein
MQPTLVCRDREVRMPNFPIMFDHAPPRTLILPSWSDVWTEALIESVYIFSAGIRAQVFRTLKSGEVMFADFKFWCLSRDGSLWIYRGAQIAEATV